MTELDSILDCWRTLEGRNRNAVLATVVHVKGSAYRRPGARMLIVPDGRRIGGISGGCLEGEIARKAWWYTESGTPVVRVYDTSSDDDVVWEFGLGCNGVIHVLLERVDWAQDALAFLNEQRGRGAASAMATVIRTEDPTMRVGERLWISDGTGPRGRLAGNPIAATVNELAGAVLRERKNRLVHLGGTEVFVEWLGPPLSVVILGAGHDAVPLAAMASQMGWRVTVADGRPAYARPERFPSAERVVLLTAGDPMRGVRIDRDTVVVMMTHNYPLDTRLLPRVLEQQPCYLGMLGPRSRTERLFDDLGLDPLASVHAPVGLDIGGDSPEGIAASIVAEIQAALSGRLGGMLKHRRGAIHAPAKEVGMGAELETRGTRPEYCESAAGSHV